jgi:hypothetical protein
MGPSKFRINLQYLGVLSFRLNAIISCGARRNKCGALVAFPGCGLPVDREADHFPCILGTFHTTPAVPGLREQEKMLMQVQCGTSHIRDVHIKRAEYVLGTQVSSLCYINQK